MPSQREGESQHDTDLFQSSYPFESVEKVEVGLGDPFSVNQNHDPFSRPVNPTRWTITTAEEQRASHQYLAALEKKLNDLQRQQAKGRKEIVDYALKSKDIAVTSAWIRALEEDLAGRAHGIGASCTVVSVCLEAVFCTRRCKIGSGLYTSYYNTIQMRANKKSTM